MGTTLNLQTGASNADGQVNAAAFDNSSTTIVLGRLAGGGAYTLFALFDPVNVPNGATIDSAYLSLYSVSIYTNTLLQKVAANAADDTAPPADAATVNGYARTTAKVDWDFANWSANTWYQSGDIKTVIQEIVNRGGWASGQALMILLDDDGTANNNLRAARSWDQAGNVLGPKLDITYSIPAARVWSAPIFF
uniref:Uncharacterized protein n=1 Tax=viral metagenome TaxID=1070528 RepID=A0A6M3IZI6_9ZZZZ